MGSDGPNEEAVEWQLLGRRDLGLAIFIPIRDELAFEFVRFGQELLELQPESFGRGEVVVRWGWVPDAMQRHIGQLDKIRNLRNKIGHAFGTDIDEARKHGVKEIPPMKPLKIDRLSKWRQQLWGVAKGIDLQLLRKRMGEFQALRFYHDLYPSLRQDVAQGERARDLRKAIGRFKAQPPGSDVSLPEGIAFDGANIWVANEMSNTVSKL